MAGQVVMNKLFCLSLMLLCYAPLWLSLAVIYLCPVLICHIESFPAGAVAAAQDLLGKAPFAALPWVGAGLAVALVVLPYWHISYVLRCEGARHSEERGYSVNKIEPQSDVTLTYLLSYVIPLAGFDFFTLQGLLCFAIFFALITYVSLKRKLFYFNVYLEWRGLRLYHATLVSPHGNEIDNCTLIAHKSQLPDKGQRCYLRQIQPGLFMTGDSLLNKTEEKAPLTDNNGGLAL